jgi:ribosome biogenesis GTPase
MNKNHEFGTRSSDRVPALIVRQERLYLTARAVQSSEEYLCSVPRRFLQHQETTEVYPVIGDRVLLTVQNADQAVIEEIMPRRNVLRRKKAGRTSEIQILAANIDQALIVSALDGGRNFNLRRMERFLAVAAAENINCTIVLNKADLCDDVERCVRQTAAAFPSLPIFAVSAQNGDHIDLLRDSLPEDSTAILLGPSGVGKSALINTLAGHELQRVGAARETDKRGRHTTTNRQLFCLDGNRRIIDTPGIREIQVCDDLQASDAFADIVELAGQCRFRDCSHRSEPGCAVQAAVADGQLDPARYRNYLDIATQHEQVTSDRKQGLRIAEKRNWKKQKYR